MDDDILDLESGEEDLEAGLRRCRFAVLDLTV